MEQENDDVAAHSNESSAQTLSSQPINPNSNSTEHANKKPRYDTTALPPANLAAEEANDRAQLLRLMEQKQRMEDEIKNLEEILEAQQGVGMSGPLLDADGYPRGDIDLYAIRYARNRIICLNNDHKALMKEIETGLFSLHDKYKRDDAAHPAADRSRNLSKPEPKPFLIVRTVTYASPASDAGLKSDDQILSFGSLNYDNFKTVLDVKGICEQAHSGKVPVLVKLLRKRAVNEQADMSSSSSIEKAPPTTMITVHINLRPRTWSGPGLLGCYVEALPRAAVANK